MFWFILERYPNFWEKEIYLADLVFDSFRISMWTNSAFQEDSSVKETS
jgi:hypothetical protein